VVGAWAGGIHTAAWTEAGELFTFGNGDDEQLDHGWHEEGGADAPYLSQLHGQAVFTQLHGLRQGSSSPLEMEMMGSWTMDGTRRGVCAKAGCKWGPGPLAAVGARVLKPESRAEACVEVAGFTALPSGGSPFNCALSLCAFAPSKQLSCHS
jgi:hypothetical protein